MAVVSDTPSQDPSQALRVGDTEREEALKALGEHLSAGRLDIDEYGDRSARVTAARTRGELAELFTDLPHPHPSLGAASAPPAGAGPVVPAEPTGAAVARPSPAGQVARNAAGAVLSLSWIAAIVVIVFVHSAWPVFFVPIALSAVFGSVWGKHWNRGDNWREHVEERREAREEWREDRDRYRRERRRER